MTTKNRNGEMILLLCLTAGVAACFWDRNFMDRSKGSLGGAFQNQGIRQVGASGLSVVLSTNTSATKPAVLEVNRTNFYRPVTYQKPTPP